MSEDKKKLNKAQKTAICYGDGPLLIIAGAGTGKTTVITERIKYLISSEKAKTTEILALTFTDKAAREMEERIDIALPYGYSDMWVSTFHSFCDRVLRQEGIHIGINPDYKLMTGAETIQFLIKNIFKFKLKYFRPLGNPTKFISGMLQHFSRLKDEDISCDEYLNWVKKQQKKKGKTKEEEQEIGKFQELALAYKTYEDLKTKEGFFDFADLISKTLELFRKRKNVLHTYQKQFSYILVDEFQDTNYAQNQLAILLAGKKQNITVSCDDDQSIYRFRGAAISNVIQFRKNHPKTKIVVLKENYRSSQLILDHAYKLIQNNNPDRLEVKEKIDKHLLAVRNVKQSPIDLIYADRVENEADSVALKVKDLSKEYEYSDFAILVRANNHAEPFIRAFARHGIPCQFLGPGQLFRQAEVKDLIAYLKILYNFEDNVALFRVLSMDSFNVFPRDLAALNNFARRQNFSLFESCEEVDKLFVGQKTKEQINSFVKMVHRHLGLLNKETAGQILYYFLQDTGLLKKLAEYKSVREEKMAQNIAKFFDRLRSYEVDHEDATVLAVVDWINLSMNLGESPSANNFDWTEENKVNILTVHSSKGLEFPVVFLINLVQARFPTQERREQIPIPDQLIKEILPSGSYHEQEERRLFYVGMTRARDKLIFSLANYYGEGKREKKISPFVIETLDEKIIKKEILEDTDQLSIFDYKKEEEQEEVLERQVIQVGYLSYSQLETFNNCPLQYRYRYLQRIPVPASAAQSLGNSVHLTLKDFLQGIKDKKKLKEKDLLSLLDKNWASLGYSDKAHEKISKKSAQRMMVNFYKDFNKKTNIQFLEQPFVIKVSPSLRVGGKIDRVDKVGKDKIEIIDYKTGRMQDQKEINKSLQMTVYALAAQDKGIYDKNPKDVILTFYFLDLGKKMSTSRTSEQLKEVREEIIKKSKEISKSDFEAKPSRLCDFCDYKLICEAWN